MEKSYVDSLQFLVIVSTRHKNKELNIRKQKNFQKYLTPLKNPENSHIIDNVLVDDIFFQVKKILLYGPVMCYVTRMFSYDISSGN